MAKSSMAGRFKNGQVVKFIPHPKQRSDETTVLLDPLKIDSSWRDDSFYVPRGGGGAEMPGRSRGARKFLATGEDFQASRGGLSRDGMWYFEDGRHRFAVLRDLGIDRVAVTVPREQVREILELFR